MGNYIFAFIGIAVIVFILALIAKKVADGELSNCQYDERQEIERGKGFKAGFFTMIIYFLLYGALESMTGIVWCETLVGMLLGICLGIFVFAAYCIMKDAYMSMNDHPKKFYISFGAVGLMNMVLGMQHIIEGEAIQDGKMNDCILNLFIGIMFLGLCIVLAWKSKKGGME